MQKVIGQHQVGSELDHDRKNLTAVLECGCEVPMSAVKLVPDQSGVPVGTAKCPQGHEAKIEAAKEATAKDNADVVSPLTQH